MRGSQSKAGLVGVLLRSPSWSGSLKAEPGERPEPTPPRVRRPPRVGRASSRRPPPAPARGSAGPPRSQGAPRPAPSPPSRLPSAPSLPAAGRRGRGGGSLQSCLSHSLGDPVVAAAFEADICRPDPEEGKVGTRGQREQPAGASRLRFRHELGHRAVGECGEQSGSRRRRREPRDWRGAGVPRLFVPRESVRLRGGDGAAACAPSEGPGRSPRRPPPSPLPPPTDFADERPASRRAFVPGARRRRREPLSRRGAGRIPAPRAWATPQFQVGGAGRLCSQPGLGPARPNPHAHFPLLLPPCSGPRAPATPRRPAPVAASLGWRVGFCDPN